MATTITVTGTFKKLDGTNRTGTVKFRPTASMTDKAGNNIMSRSWTSATIASGAISVVLYATNDPTTAPSDLLYEVRVDYTDDGTHETFFVAVPYDASGGTFDLSDRTASYGVPVSPIPSVADVHAIVNNAISPTSLRISKLTALGHSYGKLGVDDYVQLYHERLAGQLHADLEVLHVSGSRLIDGGVGYGGFIHMMRSTGWHEAGYSGEDYYTPRPGAWVIVDGINDLNTYLGTYAEGTQLAKAFPSALRSVISWLSLATFWPHYNFSTGQTFPAGSWGTTGGPNSATGYVAAGRTPALSYKYSGSNGAQVQVVTPAAAAGQTAALFFITDRVGGLFNGSVITFTVDGVATEPIGYETVDFDTGEIWPADSIDGGVAVARFALADDGATHTIVATASSGGMTYMGYGIEAMRPGLVANIARPLDAAYTSPVDDDDVTTYNTYIATVVEEFGAPIGLFDMDAILGKTAAAFDDNIHPNPEYEARIADGMYDAFRELVAATSEDYL